MCSLIGVRPSQINQGILFTQNYYKETYLLVKLLVWHVIPRKSSRGTWSSEWWEEWLRHQHSEEIIARRDNLYGFDTINQVSQSRQCPYLQKKRASSDTGRAQPNYIENQKWAHQHNVKHYKPDRNGIVGVNEIRIITIYLLYPQLTAQSGIVVLEPLLNSHI